MRDKLAKAYHTAWRWPEVYSEDTVVIWLSRFLAVVLPLSLIALAFITVLHQIGLAASIILTAVLAAVIVMLTVRLFYTEYPAVASLEEMESRRSEFFHGFPQYTSVPLIEAEPGVWVAYGHLPPEEFVSAIRSVVAGVTDDQDIIALYEDSEKSVGHLYATFTDKSDWDDGITLAKPSDEGSFPITRIEV